MGANNVWLYALTLLLFHSVLQYVSAMILHLLQEDPLNLILSYTKTSEVDSGEQGKGKNAFSRPGTWDD